jgi:hypothetical protein
MKNLPYSNDGQVWKLQHYDNTKSSHVKLISSDERTTFHFTLGTDDGWYQSRRNSQHSYSHRHGDNNHHSNDDDSLNHSKNTQIAAPRPVKPITLLQNRRTIPPFRDNSNRRVSAEYREPVANEGYTTGAGHTTTRLPDENTQNDPPKLPLRRSESQDHNRQKDTRGVDDNQGGGYYGSYKNGKPRKGRGSLKGTTRRKAKDVVKILKGKNPHWSSDSEAGDKSTVWPMYA